MSKAVPKLAQQKNPISWKASIEDRLRIVSLKKVSKRKTIGKTLSLAVITACEVFGVGKDRDS